MRKNFTLSEAGYKFLLTLEDYRTKPVLESNGFYTVGIKHNGPDVQGDKFYSIDEIEAFFNQDKKKIEDDVNIIFDSRFMTQNMFDACFSFAFNIGNISNTELGKIIQKNPYDDRIRDLWLYTYTNGRKNQKLINRRIKEVNLYYSE